MPANLGRLWLSTFSLAFSLAAQAADLTPLSIGTPLVSGSVVVSGNGITVAGAGRDIGSIIDQFEFDYQAQPGDFDFSVRVRSLTPSNPFAKAGLMARSTLDNKSAFTAVFATPSVAGCFFESRDASDDKSTNSGAFPVNYPNTWLRLRRAGDQCDGFASFDGSNWVLLGSMTFSNAVYLGLAVSSHATNELAVAQFTDFGPVTGGTIGSLTSPYEPLGPCTRRTELVFSEIMYKPAARADGLNAEFLEIYNSNPWWDDISGYRLAGEVQYTFPPNTIIPGGGFLVLAAAPADVRSAYGGLTNVTGPYVGSLKKGGQLQLLDNKGAVLLDMTYTNTLPWPAGADGTGHSIVLTRPSYGEADPRAWAVSDVVGGSPGGPEAYRPSPLRNVVINEFLAQHDSATAGYVELYNHSAAPVDISGCVLTDDAKTNKFVIPAGTVLAAAGFAAFTESRMGFALKPAGGLLLFKNPDGSRVEDAVTYEAQGLDVAFGRWPDGARDLYPMASNTPGTANGGIWIGDVVINEIMYKPISGNDDDQYVELYNKGTHAVILDGWRFTTGISFQFPAGTSLAPGGYLVVARNMTNLFAKYPNLNSANTAGNYTGKLPHKGGRLALALAETAVGTTTTIYPVADEVTYTTGGRWGQWAHGGGSSLELINPNTNHRLASNWADSDETAKSSWTNLVFTGLLDQGQFPGETYTTAMQRVQVGLLDVGEALVDNLGFQGGTNGINLIQNGDFENGLTGWSLQGDHLRSSLETVGGLGGYQSAQSLHLRASDGIWTGANSAQTTLADNTLTVGQTATLSLVGRWLRGSSEVLLRVAGNWLEMSGAFPIPANLGTPGLPNSQAVTNAAVAIYEVTHSPAIPAGRKPLLVTARFHSGNAFNATLLYRIDGDGATNLPFLYTTIRMVDDGTGGDLVANDGIYSATIPEKPEGTVVPFIIQATDMVTGAQSIFPSVLNDNSGIPRECVVVFGDATPSGAFGHHHLWMTQLWNNRWTLLGGLSNEEIDCTFVDGGGRIIYNMGGRYSGSASHQESGSPTGHTSEMQWKMPADDMMLGTTSFDKQHIPGNGPYLDYTLQREQTAFWMARQMGLPWNYRRYYVLYVNGLRYGPLMEDTQLPNGDYITEHFPSDDNGFLYKNSVLFEFPNSPDTRLFQEDSCCPMAAYTTTNTAGLEQFKLASYRWTYWIRQYPDSASNFTNVFALISAANAFGTSSYYAGMEALVDTEEYMRMSAAEHATGDGDSLVSGNQQNMYMYKPLSGKLTLLKWDWNVGMGNGGWGPDGDNLFSVSNVTTLPRTPDLIMQEFQSYLPYRRAMLRAFRDLANGPMNIANAGPVMDAKYAAFAANGLADAPYNVSSPEVSYLSTWIATMQDSLLNALTNQGVDNVAFTAGAATNSITGTNWVILAGTAPVGVKNITVNGANFPVDWTTITNWVIQIPPASVADAFNVQGVDLTGNPVAGAFASISITDTNSISFTPQLVKINEWMAGNKTTIYDPADGQSEDWFELYNPNPVSIDLSGFHLTKDLTKPTLFAVPSGTVIPAAGFLLVWADDGLTNALDGPNNYLHANFKLSKSGTSIGLFDPTGELVDAVTFGAQTSDISQGRFPDGSTNIVTLTSATPGTPNAYVTLPPAPSPITILQSQLSNGQFVVTWVSQPGQTYFVQYKDDLSSTNWSVMDASVEATGTNASMGDFFSPTNSPRFYRIFTLP